MQLETKVSGAANRQVRKFGSSSTNFYKPVLASILAWKGDYFGLCNERVFVQKNLYEGPGMVIGPLQWDNQIN